MAEISVSEHINGELRDYSIYTIYERALPGIDGLKPSQRKAIFSARKMCSSHKVKTMALTGETFKQHYHHGDSSMNSCISQLASEWNNNVPLLLGEGFFGSRLVQEPASPRYTSVMLSPVFKKYFPDDEVCPENADGEHPEPVNYLPIIPWVLINGVKGIATGFACSILPRSVEDIAALCIDYMLGKALPVNVKPTFPHFNGKVTLDGETWVVSGTLLRKSPTIFEITELPIGYDREKYISVLNKLEDDGIILSFSDECSKKGFRFGVKLPRSSKNMTDQQILTKMKLVKRYTDNITTINQHGELVIHNNVAELIADFCDYRLSCYSDRYAFRIARDTSKRTELHERIRFCELVIDGTIIFKGKTKAEVSKQLTALKFIKLHKDKFIELPVHSLTVDSLDRLKKEIKTLDNNIKTWHTTDTKKQYTKELGSL